VVLLDGYKPTVGDTFDIVTFGGTASGIFTNLKGLYGFDSDHYFEVVQSSNKIQLVTREIISGDDFSFVTDAPGSANNESLGMLLNTPYLISVPPTSVTLSGNIELGNAFKLGGTFTFAEQVTPTTLILNDAGASTVNITSITVSGRGLALLFGSPVDGSGLSISDVDFGLAQFKPLDSADSRSWLMTKGSIGAAGAVSFVNLGPLSVSAGTISFDISQGLGSANTTVANLSSSPVVISDATGTLVTFNSAGSRGEYFDVAATALKFSLADTVSVEGNFMFSSDGTRLAAIGSGVNALFGTVDMNIGVTNATIALLDSKSDGLALQASGEFSANLGSDISLSATGSSLLWKENALSLTVANQTLTIGSSSFTFSDELVASTGIQEVRVSGAVLQVGDFFMVSGNLAFKKSTSDFVDSKGVTVHADVLTLGSTGLNVFVGANGASVDRMGMSLTGVDFALALAREQGSARQWTALKGSAQSASALGIPDVTLTSNDLNVAVNLQASDGTVIDFSQTAFQVATGVGTSMTLDFTGPLVKAAGTFDVGVADFLSLTGSMAFEKKSQNLTVQASNGTTSTVLMDILTLGGIGIDAFVGMNGGSTQQLGLVLAGTKFAMLMAQDQANKKRKWSSIKAGADSAAFVGVDGMTLAGSNLSVDVNRASTEDASLLDFAVSSYQVPAGPSESVAIDFNADKGALLQASGNLNVDLFGFFQVSGGLAFEKKSESVKVLSSLGATTDVTVDVLTIGTSGVSAFAGLNGGTSNKLGLDLTGTEFALVLASDHATPTRKWTSLQASATSVAFVGVDGLTIGATGLTVEVNKVAAIDGSIIDYAAKNLAVSTGPTTTLKLDMDGSKGELLQVSGNLTLDLFGFFNIHGNLAIEKSTSSVTLGDSVVDTAGTITKPASQVTVDMLSIGGSGLDAFAGISGGYDASGKLNSRATGLSLSGVEFGLTMAGEKPTGLEPTGYQLRKWTSLQAMVGSTAFIGIEGLVIAADTLSVEINRAATDGTLADYKAQSLAINTGTMSDPGSLTLTMDASEGQLLRATGNLEVDVFGLMKVAGSFGIEKKSGGVTLADITSTPAINESETPVTVDMLLIGGSGLDAFIGAGGVGLELGDVNVGLALLGEQLTDAQVTTGKVARKWTTIQAEVGSAALVGVDGLTVGVETLSVSVNRQALDTSVVDYSLKAGSTTERKTDLTILTGPASDMALTIDGGRGQFVEASGHLTLDVFGFVQVNGEFAIEKASTPETLTLSDATTVNAEVLRIGASNLSAFAGMNGGTADAIGLDLSGVEFGLALMTEVPAAGVTTLPRSWTSVQATAESAAFVGVDGLTARGENIAVTVNRAGTLTDLVVDYSLKTEGGTERKTSMTVRTGISDSLTFDMDGSDGRLLRASADLKLDLFGFFQVSGGFAIEKRSESFMLNDGVVSEVPADAKAATEINAELLTIGGSGIDAFAGMNGGTADAIGLNLSKVDFGLALITEVVADDAPAGTTARSFTTLKANAGEISFVGVKGLTASATELSVEINRGIAGTAGNADLVVDYSGRQLDVLAGPDATVTLDSDGTLGELTRAIGTLDINLFNFVSLNGNFTVESSSKEVHLAGADAATAGEVVQTDMLAIGGSNVSAFVGLNGGSADAMGLQLTTATFGLALLSSKGDPTRSWTSLQANADELSFVGLEGLTASADNITISINQAGNDGDKVIDYAGANSTSLAIQTSQTTTLSLGLEGSEGETIKAAGNLDIDLFGFFSVKGGLALEQRSQEVMLSDGSVIKAAELITIGGHDLNAFAGINGGYNDTTGVLNGDAMGLSLGTVNFGLALIGDPSDTTRSFTSLQATAGSASVVGIEGLTMQVNDMLVNINQGITVAAEPAKSIKPKLSDLI